MRIADSKTTAGIAPAVFSANGNGLVVGWGVRVSSTGAQTILPALTVNTEGSLSPAPISMGTATDQTCLAFYATGVQAAGLANVTGTVNGVNAPVSYAGNGGYPGIDHVNVLLPASLAGSGTVILQLTASRIVANPVQIAIQ